MVFCMSGACAVLNHIFLLLLKYKFNNNNKDQENVEFGFASPAKAMLDIGGFMMNIKAWHSRYYGPHRRISGGGCSNF